MDRFLHQLVHGAPVQRLLRRDTPGGEQLGHADAEDPAQGKKKLHVGKALTPLPFADGLVGEKQLIRQLLLSPALFLPQLRYKSAEALPVDPGHVHAIISLYARVSQNGIACQSTSGRIMKIVDGILAWTLHSTIIYKKDHASEKHWHDLFYVNFLLLSHICCIYIVTLCGVAVKIC